MVAGCSRPEVHLHAAAGCSRLVEHLKVVAGCSRLEEHTKAVAGLSPCQASTYPLQAVAGRPQFHVPTYRGGPPLNPHHLPSKTPEAPAALP